jgi:hypothetical protein
MSGFKNRSSGRVPAGSPMGHVDGTPAKRLISYIDAGSKASPDRT